MLIYILLLFVLEYSNLRRCFGFNFNIIIVECGKFVNPCNSVVGLTKYKQKLCYALEHFPECQLSRLKINS